MVRPVEPEPPDVLRRVDQRVKRTDATPDKLGNGLVSERERQSRQHEEHPEERPVPTDSVEIKQLGEVQIADVSPEKPPGADRGLDHIDVKKSPVYTSRVECPVCKSTNDFEGIKVGSYTESGRDTDFSATGRIWRNPDFQNIHPLVYSMATCAACFYTRELDGNYRNWQRDVTFKMYRQKPLREGHLKKLAEPDSLPRKLGAHLDTATYPHESAVNKLLLGILDEQLIEGRDDLNVARFFLRIAWIYRETGNPDHGVDVRALSASRLRNALVNQGRNFEAWVSQLRGLASELQSLVADAQGAEAALPGLESEVRTLLDGWRLHLESLQQNVKAQTQAMEKYFEFANHLEFLSHLRLSWDEVPLNEGDALVLALKYYLSYFQNARSFESPELEVQTTYLIGELARRTSQTQLANDYFNHAMRKGQKLVHELKNDPARVNYVHKLLEMAFEQGKKNRAAEAVDA